MNLRALETLVAISIHGSFQRAATMVGLTQSTVSMQIQALESEFGVALFDRSTRPPSLTREALLIIQPAKEICELARLIRNTLKPKTGVFGQLRLGAFPMAMLGLLPDALLAIGRDYPQLQILVQSALTDVLIAKVVSGELDAAIVTEPEHLPAGISNDLILRERLAIVSSSKKYSRNEVPPIEGSPFIRFNRTIGVGKIIDAYLLKRKLRINEIMEIDSVEAILALVERGIGIAIVPERAIWRHNADINISPLNDADATRNVSMIYQQSTNQQVLLAVVLEAFRDASSANA